MKIICINNNNNNNYLSYHLRPDTALLRNNETFFVPEFAEQLVAECALVYKINRIVKAIEPKFAQRCYTQISIATIFTAKNLIVDKHPWEMATSFDHSFALSPRFIDLPTDNLTTTHFLVELNNLSVDTIQPKHDIINVIAQLSEFMTLKIGDLITMPITNEMSVQIDDKITTSLAGTKLQEFDVR